eukprot:TRINITY_DN509_c1_g1_i1.p1 TRINITY_DN509_c1_g1~~TRINITY_DN509_c1_g1_i1.p1  ORF type:complete len:433 (-),score=210.18 TRINITY_DN509_c1_g1_i1:346-1644(-)
MELTEEKAIEQWKIKKLIQNLDAAKGNGTSMISLIMPPKEDISRVNRMLTTEYGTASNIKDRVNRQSVLSAITSTQQKLRQFNRTPDNGLVIFCGTILTEDNKEKRVTIDIEPFKPINTFLYMCDNRFHTESLHGLLESDKKFGFIIMDGSGVLFGTLSGNTREVLHKMGVDLPKKHGRGGQSALRFARLRLEKRHNYVRKVAELAVQLFITNDRPNVSGLVLAGLAEFKNELSISDMFDQRLKEIIIKIIDVSYGGENGFSQAIELAADCLANVKFVQETRLISAFFEELAKDTNMVIYGINDTIAAWESGAVKTLVAWENLDFLRVTLRNAEGQESIRILRPRELTDASKITDSESGAVLDVIDQMPLLEWLAEHYKERGAQLEIVTDKSQEGAQFVRGFGGFGGFLRFPQTIEEYAGDEGDFDYEAEFI